jgi:hypothetical protein
MRATSFVLRFWWLLVLVVGVGCGGGSDDTTDVGDVEEFGDVEPEADAPDADAPDADVEPDVVDVGDAEIGDVPGDEGGDLPDGEETDVETGCTGVEECDDGVACTVDACESDGTCSHSPDHGACDDGFACTADRCDAAAGCLSTADDAACSNDDACDGIETCALGVGCVAGTAVDCDDELACTADVCDPADGSCSSTASDALCDDGVACTVDLCDAATGACSNAPDDAACDDGIDCTVDSCDATAGCLHAADHSVCSDDDACNGDEVCIPGTGCVDGWVVDCDDGIDCTVDTCDPSDGSCANAPDDAACPASPLCSGAVTCDPVAGCIVGAAIDCDDGVDCTTDACDPATGDCLNVPSAAFCSDDVFCNGDEVCDPALDCLPGAVRTCTDGVACTVDVCDEAADACVRTPDDSLCANGNPCDGDEFCNPVAGCRTGALIDCSDGIACTVDACNPSDGSCSHTANHAACDDGRWCTGAETCVVATGCAPGTPVSCNDFLACTVDACDESADACQYTADHGLCDAGFVCLPASGGCSPGTLCTADSECGDGDFCNGVEVCGTGTPRICTGGVAPNCADTDPCTIDTCSSVAGACVHTPRDVDGDTYGDDDCGGTDCNDGNPMVHPGVPDDDCDGVDDDCDTVIDGGKSAAGGPCTVTADCCEGSCIGGTCTEGYGLCEGPGETCTTPADCCSGQCEIVAGGARECVGAGFCGGEGDPCIFSVDCCSLWCSGGVCAVGSTCGVVASTCTTGTDCCSGICTGGTCSSIGGVCGPLGETCSSAGGCCSGFCDAGHCAFSFFCGAEGEVCDEGGDCCNDICDDYVSPADPGRCAFLGGCDTVGQPCTGNRACCSLACVDPGTGTRVCTYLSGCRPMGELCVTDADCCGSRCRSDDGGLSMRCQNPPGCQPAGEMCGTGASNNCCGGNENCRPTIAGVSRCWSPGWTVCLPEGSVCAIGDECCSGVCAQWPDGIFRCGACSPEGGSCATDFDCCDGVCRDGVCGPPDSDCFPLGHECVDDIDCCSGDCYLGFCAVLAS